MRDTIQSRKGHTHTQRQQEPKTRCDMTKAELDL